MTDDHLKKPEPDTNILHELVEAAYKEINDLCHHRHKWRMSIPVQPGDSDVVLVEALKAQSMAIEHLKAELAEAHRLNRLYSDCLLRASRLTASRDEGGELHFLDGAESLARLVDEVARLKDALRGQPGIGLDSSDCSESRTLYVE